MLRSGAGQQGEGDRWLTWGLASLADRGRMLPDPTTLPGKVHSAGNRREHLPTDTAFSCQCLAVSLNSSLSNETLLLNMQ